MTLEPAGQSASETNRIGRHEWSGGGNNDRNMAKGLV